MLTALDSYVWNVRNIPVKHAGKNYAIPVGKTKLQYVILVSLMNLYLNNPT